MVLLQNIGKVSTKRLFGKVAKIIDLEFPSLIEKLLKLYVIMNPGCIFILFCFINITHHSLFYSLDLNGHIPKIMGNS